MNNTKLLTNNSRNLYTFAGGCAIIAMIANLLDIVFGFGETDLYVYGTKSVVEWFDLYQTNWLKGIYLLGVFNIVYMSCMISVYFGMIAAHFKSHFVPSIMVLVLSVLALAMYVSSNAAIPMLVLSEKYAATSIESQKIILIAAGELALARGEDFTPGSFLGLFTSGIAAITTAVIMLKAGIFQKLNAWLGIIGFTFLTAFTCTATFFPAIYMFSYYFFGLIGGVLALTWFVMVGIKFFNLARA